MMVSRTPWHPSDRPPSWLAWCASVAVHAGLCAVLLLLVRAQLVEGAAEEPTREVGIALKRMTDEGPRFEGEQDQPTAEQDSPAPGEPSRSLIDALPAEAELPSMAAALPQLPAIGPGALDQGELGDAGALARGGPTNKRIGGQAHVGVFGVEGVGTKFVYLFDRSISMEGAPLAAAKQQLVASLDSLESIHQFQIIFFNHQPQAWDITGGQERIAFATDRNKRLAVAFVRGITAQGGTSRLSALRLALRLQPDAIFFLTDADDPMPAADVKDLARRAERSGTAILAIEFGDGPSRRRENFLTVLARSTGGQYDYVDTQQLRR